MIGGIKVRTAAPGKEDTTSIFYALIPFYREVGRAEMNMQKALLHIANVIERGIAIIVENDRSEVIGTAGLTVDQHWYSDHIVLTDSWLYVRPADRGGPALREMLDMIRAAAVSLQADVMLTLTPPRRSRSARGEDSIMAETLGFTIGRRLTINSPNDHGKEAA